MTTARRKMSLISLGVVSATLTLGLAMASKQEPTVGVFLAWSSGLSICFAATAIVVLRPTPLSGVLGWIIGFAVLLRVAGLVGEPLFENDMHRYIWDGKVASHGVNPYIFAPDDLALADLRDENWEAIAYREIPTIYPPLAQMVFRASYEIAPGSALALRIILVLLDCAVIGVCLALLRTLERPASWVVLYAWNPLVLKEVANSGHVDVIAVLGLLTFLLLFVRSRALPAGVALSGAILAKLFPLVLLPALLRSLRVPLILGLFLGLVAGYAFYLDAELLLGTGLFTYLRYWEFNDSLFVVLHAPFSAWGDTGFRIAQGIAGALVVTVGLFHSRSIREDARNVIPATLAVLGTLLLFGPVADPWYLLWIAPLLCFVPSLPWLVLTQTAAISYVYWIDEADRWWIRPLEYGPFFVLLLHDRVRIAFRRLRAGTTRTIFGPEGVRT